MDNGVQDGAPKRFVTEDPPPAATVGLIVVIVAIWLTMWWKAGSIEETASNVILEAWGAAVRPGLWATGQWWRLFTANFVHIGPIHLAVNSYSLYMVGRAVESLFERWRMLYIFLVAGVSGATASTILGGPFVISAGASGAIFGLLGAVVWFRLASPLGNRIPWRTLLLNVGINVAIGLSLARYIDNWNHIGGLVGGFVAAFAAGVPKWAGPSRFALPRPLQAAMVAILLLAGGAVVGGQVELPGSGRDYLLAADAYNAGRLTEAEKGFKALAERYPDEARFPYLLAATYVRQGRCAEANAALNSARAIEPEMRDPMGVGAAVRGCKP